MVNILRNPGFDTDVSGWGVSGSPTFEIYDHPTIGRIARIVPRLSSGSLLMAEIYQTGLVSPAGTNKVSFDAMLSPGDTSPQTMAVYIFDTISRTSILYKTINLSTTWTHFEFNVVVPVNQGITFDLQFSLPHIFFIDNVVFDSPGGVATITKVIKVREGDGTVSVYRNGSLVGTASNASSVSLSLIPGDVARFLATDLFIKWCDSINTTSCNYNKDYTFTATSASTDQTIEYYFGSAPVCNTPSFNFISKEV